jgi:tetratricopeptide (TPR) repeat protein
MTSPHSTVHIFVDESGNLAGRLAGEDIRLVGGVAILGEFGAFREEQLREALEESCRAAGMPYPDGLHGSSFRSRREQKDQFFAELRSRLEHLQGPDFVVGGVAVRHHEDLLPAAASIARETSLDNRYKALLWTLLEHLLFVDFDMRGRLHDTPEVRLTVASRMWVDDSGAYDAAGLHALGLSSKMVEDRNARHSSRHSKKKVAVPDILHESDLLTMFQMGVRSGWPSRSLNLTGVEVQWLDYRRGRSAPGLYLADLYLSSLRHALKRHPEPGSAIETVVPTLLYMEHSRKTEALAKARRALAADDLDRLMEQVPTLLPPDSDYVRQTVEHMLPGIGRAFSKAPDRWVAWWQETARRVELPGRSEEGENLVQVLAGVAPHVKLSELTPGQQTRATFRRIEAQLSLANKKGDLEAANRAWDEFANCEKPLDALGLEALGLRARIRRDRAVALMEHFRYEQALDSIEQLLHDFEETEERLQAAQLPNLGEDQHREQASLYAARGEIRCLMTPWAGRKNWDLWRQAEEDFRRAIALNPHAGEQRRYLTYLGHLACDMGRGGRTLWDDLVDTIPRLALAEPLRGRENLDLLAIQVKGWLCFETDHAKRLEYIKAWRRENPIEGLLPEERTLFPIGLILQNLGLLALETDAGERPPLRNLGRECLRQAATTLRKGGPMLHLLAAGARMRLALANHDLTPPGTDDRKTAGAELQQALTTLISVAREHWGDHLWSTADDGTPTGLLGFLAAPTPDLPAGCKAILTAFRMRVR